MISAWPLEDSFYPTADAEGSDVAMVRRFEPDVGPPIDRPATTATLEKWPLTVFTRSAADFSALMSWGRGTLSQWTLPFIWRHPRTCEIGRWKFVSPPSHQRQSASVTRVSFNALALPGSVWFAPYIPMPYAKLPLWVADYAGGVYGVGDARGVAADLSALSGTYLVWQKDTAGTQSFSSRTYSGDIPTTAPTGVDWLVGFAL